MSTKASNQPDGSPCSVLDATTELPLLPWRRVQPQEVLDGEYQDAGRVQAEERRLVAIAAR